MRHCLLLWSFSVIYLLRSNVRIVHLDVVFPSAVMIGFSVCLMHRYSFANALFCSSFKRFWPLALCGFIYLMHIYLRQGYCNVDGQSIARQRLSKHVKTYVTIEVRVFIVRFWTTSSAPINSLRSAPRPFLCSHSINI
jgi:hypothetical protein